MRRRRLQPLIAIMLALGFLATASPANAVPAATKNPSSISVVVNKKNTLRPKTYRPSRLVSVGNGQSLRPAPAADYKKMAAAANRQGHRIYPISGYRSYATQRSTYNYWVSR